ncbi:MAG: hypothetical protein Q4F06_04230 [Eubacteriales bacterium]|nr:hypothetical protein [Eubacteriales bacterium]
MTYKKKAIAALLSGVVLAVVVYVTNINNKNITDNIITRPEPGASDELVELNVYDEEGHFKTNISTFVEPRKLTDSETEEYFDAAYHELEVAMLGNNESFHEIRQNIELKNTAMNGIISARWYSDNYEFIDYDGTVYNHSLGSDDSVDVTLTLMLEYGDKTTEKNIVLTVKAPAMDDEVENGEYLKKQIESAMEESKEQENIYLPDSDSGGRLIYKRVSNPTSPMVFVFLGALASFLIVYEEKNKAIKEEAKRKKEITYDYSEVVSKLTLLMGAGMTVRRAWSKIVEDYNKQKEITGKRRYIYEEMIEAECSMNAGIPETAVYEQFGRRCNTKEYLKLSSLLQTNIKKGTKELTSLLEQEVIESFQQRKNMARQKGEEATTKLLFPMILMLVVVMIIVLAPAVMSFKF